MTETADKPLGQQYYRRFFENDPFSPMLRQVAEKSLPFYGKRKFGTLILSYLDTQTDYSRVSVATYNHRSEIKDVIYAMKTAADLEIPTIRPVMKSDFANAYFTRVFHKLGGVGVGRGTGDGALLTDTMAHLAQEGFSPAYFNEGRRVKSHDKDGNIIYGPDGEPVNTRKIYGVKPGAARVALKAGIPYLPIALAGTATDDRIDAGRLPIVACVAPYLFPADFRHFDDPLREMTTAALEYQQSALDEAYLERQMYESGTKTL